MTCHKLLSPRQQFSVLVIILLMLSKPVDYLETIVCTDMMRNLFAGSHTAENIKTHFYETVLTEYDIRQKISYVISDNAANMKKAFTITFHDQPDNLAIPAVDVDDPDLWADHDDVAANLEGMCRLSCFAHSLQLVIGDGIKDTKSINCALAKASKLSSTLHTSSTFKDLFEKEFGQASIPQQSTTRWNSLLLQIQSVLKLDPDKLEKVMLESRKMELKLTAREREQLSQLVYILEPFLEATLITQGDQVGNRKK